MKPKEGKQSDESGPRPVDRGGDAEASAPGKSAKQREPGKGLDYEFKIAPADPKNAFDFEDVADK